MTPPARRRPPSTARTADPLVERIGREGDARLARTVGRADDDGDDIPFDPPAPHHEAMLSLRLAALIDDRTPALTQLFLCAAIVPAALVDIAVKVLFTPIYLAALAFWLAERGWSRWAGRSYFCPLCTNPARDPLVYCRHCRTAQPRLRPTFRAPLVWRCACGRGRWWTVGQYLFGTRGPLCCRDLPDVTGCYHEHPVPDIAGLRAARVAVAGASTRAKHAVMAHLFGHLARGSVRELGRCEPACSLSEMELELCEDRLHGGFFAGGETADCEMPGAEYPLALGFLMTDRRSRVLAFHNVAQPWIGDTAALVRRGINWEAVRSLVFVLEPEQLARPRPRAFPQAEAFSHLFQAVEQFCGVRPGRPLPLRVAVILPVPTGAAFAPLWRAASPDARHDGFRDDEVRDLLRRNDPATAALFARCLKPSRVAYFGGVIPPAFDLDRTDWLRDAIRWLL